MERHGAHLRPVGQAQAPRQGPLLPRRRPHRRSGHAGQRQAGAEARAALAQLRRGERHPALLRREPDHPAHQVLPGPGAAQRRGAGRGFAHLVARRPGRGLHRPGRRGHRGGHGPGHLLDRGAGSHQRRVPRAAPVRLRRQGSHPAHPGPARAQHGRHGAVGRVPGRRRPAALHRLPLRHREHDRRVRRAERHLRGGRGDRGVARRALGRGRRRGAPADARLPRRSRGPLCGALPDRAGPARAAGGEAVLAGQRGRRERGSRDAARRAVHRRLHHHRGGAGPGRAT